ncbi:VP3 [Kummerowia striata gokushovirus]|nr:VP3 [Kummerowia striata gokushovirus]
MLASLSARAERIMSLSSCVMCVASSLHCDFQSMEKIMDEVKPDVEETRLLFKKQRVRKYDLPDLTVRKGLYRDGPVYDDGVDCSVDPDTGEELQSLTKQSFRDECDINNIMRRYEATGTIDHINRRQPQYGDFSDVSSYQEAIDIVTRAEELFSELPARVRDRFNNDPNNLLEFMADPNNKDEAMELGLIAKPVEPANSPAPVPAPSAPAPAPAPSSSPPQPKGP